MSSFTKGQKRLLGVMVLVIGYGIFDVMTNKDSYFSYYGVKTKSEKISHPNVGDQNAPQIKKLSIRNAKYLQTWGQDPFYNQRFVRRRVVPVITRGEIQLNLKAISYNGENSVVMINDRVLMAGDVIEGYQIRKIEPNRVTLVKGGENKILILR
jgi:hypothetical protein